MGARSVRRGGSVGEMPAWADHYPHTGANDEEGPSRVPGSDDAQAGSGRQQRGAPRSGSLDGVDGTR